MSKRKYISPQSTEVLLYVEHILATSLGVDKSTDVDESDKSMRRNHGSDELWNEMYKMAED